MALSLIVAAARNGVIGRDGQLPWHLSADLKRFKRLTMGHTIIMGRKTYESIGRTLPGRTSVVLSRNDSYRPDGVSVAATLDEALRLAASDDQIFVIGGAAIFSAALPMAATIYMTRVHADVEGDVRFPEFDTRQWQLVEEEHHEADEKNAYALSFEIYRRKA